MVDYYMDYKLHWNVIVGLAYKKLAVKLWNQVCHNKI